MRAESRINKSSVAKARLRAKFAREDRLMRDLAATQAEIKALVRTVSTFEGLVTPMRVEQARQFVMEDVVSEEKAA